MIYAIVDIETTGGYAAASKITEIAIQLHDGVNRLETFQTLINPEQPIPKYIQALTGITPKLIADSPVFEEIAGKIFSLLEGKVFVAHNVNFDFSFLKHQLQGAGFDLNVKKLCTVRLSRQIIPGLPSYSLGNLCRHLGIPVNHRHRAGGDTEATTDLFEYLLQHDAGKVIDKYLQRTMHEHYLPVNLSKEKVRALPVQPGVYYFHDSKGKIIYVGKAKNIRKRVTGHFTHHDISQKRQVFLRNIFDVSYKACASELMASILECIEIKRLWPVYNYSLKKYDQLYGLYMFEDQNGYLRLVVDKKRKHIPALIDFTLLTEGHALLRKLVKEFNLCYQLCFLQNTAGACAGYEQHTCYGACVQLEVPDQYNQRIRNAVESFQQQQPSLAIIGEGLDHQNKSCVLIENGIFFGMGYFPADFEDTTIKNLKSFLTPYPDYFYIRNVVLQYARQHPDEAISID
jgi:DNA polymerase III subunit epsilon